MTYVVRLLDLDTEQTLTQANLKFEWHSLALE
jgi:hypothetical protein